MHFLCILVSYSFIRIDWTWLDLSWLNSIAIISIFFSLFHSLGNWTSACFVCILPLSSFPIMHIECIHEHCIMQTQTNKRTNVSHCEWMNHFQLHICIQIHALHFSVMMHLAWNMTNEMTEKKKKITIKGFCVNYSCLGCKLKKCMRVCSRHICYYCCTCCAKQKPLMRRIKHSTAAAAAASTTTNSTSNSTKIII